MNHIVQHIPSFVDHRDKVPEADFTTLTELMEIPWVKSWLDEEGNRLCVDGRHLMVESTNRKWWWVVGYLKEDVPELPRWAGGK